MSELEQERAKLFEMFKAGWTARARIAGSGRSYHTPEDLSEAFDAWLQEQVDEVDVLGRGRKTLREVFDEVGPVRIVGREADTADAAYFETALSETRAPEDIFGPFDPQEVASTGNSDEADDGLDPDNLTGMDLGDGAKEGSPVVSNYKVTTMLDDVSQERAEQLVDRLSEVVYGEFKDVQAIVVMRRLDADESVADAPRDA